MVKRKEGLLNDLARLPWWVGVSIAVAVFIAFKFILPSIEFENAFSKSFALISPNLAWCAIIFLFPAVLSATESFRKRKLLERQTGIESIQTMSWKEFEELLAEAYRREGYSVKENDSAGPDGGVDIFLEKDKNQYLVQCKNWRSNKVGVKVIRELYGVMAAEKATGCIVVTSGMFTQEAKNFATDKPIDLVEGNQLVEMIQNVKESFDFTRCNENEDTPSKCPSCGSDLVLREAKRGSQIGTIFWGCSSFPKCKFTKSYKGEQKREC